MPPARATPPRAPGPDDHQVASLNGLWRVAPPVPASGRGVRTRLAQFIWRTVTPWLERQQAFNAALVDHVNRTVARDQERDGAMGAALDALGDHIAAIGTFHAHLIMYLQQVTLYVDTKDRAMLGGLMHVYDQALNAVTDELLKRSESMAAREQRFVARLGTVDLAHRHIEEMRGTVATLQQATLTLKREMERQLAAGVVVEPAELHAMPGAAGAAAARTDALAEALESWKYVGFEDRFRGAQDEIRHRLTDYVPDFAGASDVLDVGCGRGEFLDLLREAGVTARGLDLNHEMVEVCRARGLDAVEGDALGYLQSLPDGALGGLLAAQVVEHLDPTYMMRTLETAFHALRPGSRIILETINPACWYAFFESYIRDLTHVRPIHPDTLQYLLSASGFQQVEIRYRAPYPEREKLQPVVVGPDEPELLRDLTETLNANTARLNGLLFTHLDYAAVAVRL
jgi:SAM-dependent methyltransferase